MQKSMWDEATPINRTAARIGGKQNKIKRTKTNRKTSGHSSLFPGPKQFGIAHPVHLHRKEGFASHRLSTLWVQRLLNICKSRA